MLISTRKWVRLVSFTVAIGVILIAKNWQLMFKIDDSKRALNTNYMRAISELSEATDTIANTLEKELYAGTPEMHQKLSSELWRESSTAKAALRREVP